MKIEHCPFEAALEKAKKAVKVEFDNQLTADHLKELISRYKDIIKKRTKSSFPQDPDAQLWGSVGAVLNHGKMNVLLYIVKNMVVLLGALRSIVQAMVSGNMGNDCATGVAFTQ